MGAKCKRCGALIFDPDDGQCYGRQEPDGGGFWICDDCDTSTWDNKWHEDGEAIRKDFVAKVTAYEGKTGRCFFCHRSMLDCICEEDYLEEWPPEPDNPPAILDSWPPRDELGQRLRN